MSLQIIAAALLSLLALVPVVLYFYFKFYRTAFQYWEKRGVECVPGKFPYGSSKDVISSNTFKGHVYHEIYKRFPGQPYFGIYRGTKPLLVLRDPDIIRHVLVKEFSHFRDRTASKYAEDDILAKHLFLLNGEKWRALRVKMAPAFTTGKLKLMFPLFVKCSEVMENLLMTKVESDIPVKDLTSRYSVDVICSCAFGLDANIINDDASPFRKYMKDGQGGPMSGWKNFILSLKEAYLPFLSTNQKRRITSIDLENFMMNTVRDTVEHREKTGQKRNDFIDLLIELKKKGNLADADKDVTLEPVLMTLEFMAAQCYVFFAAGHETSSSVKTFCLYELALNQSIQDRLRQEIQSTIEKHGEITYQAVQEMEYLDMVVNETLRKYPTVLQLDRTCTSDFTFPEGHSIEKGTKLMIPVWAIHRDPELYPEPDRFDPGRFTTEAREARHPFAFLPFGEGPRVCIGQRFGLLQTKMGLITFLNKFKVETCDKTTVPLEYDGSSPILTIPKEPIILKLLRI